MTILTYSYCMPNFVNVSYSSSSSWSILNSKCFRNKYSFLILVSLSDNRNSRFSYGYSQSVNTKKPVIKVSTYPQYTPSNRNHQSVLYYLLSRLRSKDSLSIVMLSFFTGPFSTNTSCLLMCNLLYIYIRQYTKWYNHINKYSYMYVMYM